MSRKLFGGDGNLANSLHEQLLKAGLVDEKKIHKAKKAKQRKEREQRHSKQKTEDESKRLAREAKVREAARNRELNRQKNATANQKAITAQVRQLVEENRLPLEDGEISYHFDHAGKIQRLLVDKTQHGQLSRGQLAVVILDDRYELVPIGIAEKIRSRDEASVILIHEDSEEGDANDTYADFKVPDDLIW